MHWRVPWLSCGGRLSVLLLRRTGRHRRPESVGDEFDQGTDIVGRLGLGEGRVIGGDMGQDESDDVIVTPTAGEVAAFAPDLPEHLRLLSRHPHLTQVRRVGNAQRTLAVHSVL
jgi:hypothetical protein